MVRRIGILAVYGAVVAAVLLLSQCVILPSLAIRSAPYSSFLDALDNRNVAEARIGPEQIIWTTRDKGQIFSSIRPPGLEQQDLIARLRESGARFSGMQERNWLLELAGWMLPLVSAAALWLLIVPRLTLPWQQQALTFGRNRAKIYDRGTVRVTFADVAGVDEAVAELREIVDFLRRPERYHRLGGRIPKGVLLVGPPGTGKTLLARATAGEAGVPFFSLSGSEFVEMFVGVGAARVRDLFEQAKQKAPCIIFIDEIDTIGRQRGLATFASNEEREQTLNQLLVEMDGFESKKGVIIMAATNRPDVLDPALLRPGRFDRQIIVDRPDIRGREAILRLHARGVRLAPDVDLRVIAARTPGFAGAELANVINEAALLAARHDRDAVTMADLEEAIDRVMAGLERRSRVLSEQERDIVAHHEIGHALVASLLPHADPVHRVSIVARGPAALGMTLQLPLQDRYLYTEDELHDRMAVLLGGRAAEELVYGRVSTGAQNDLMQATELAERMVREFGMSPRLGPLAYPAGHLAGLRRPLPFGLDGAERPLGGVLADAIDAEIKAIVERNYERARRLLSEHMELLRALAAELKQREVMEGKELQERVRAWLAATRTAPCTPDGRAPADDAHLVAAEG
jgi:cell division protease FtsH